MSTGIVAVGAPPTFRQQVARSIETPPEAIEWVPTITAAEELLAPGGTPPMVIVLSPAVKDADALGLTKIDLGSTWREMTGLPFAVSATSMFPRVAFE